ncbi:hydroxymethylpyrimidine/phosphomethylpyrimidine kinase [Aestuariibaculum sediminum]|uniref:hydroxymethylpyrimidine kinase n=1 Tax=Aestuariibaculum sediminum TaxID=2770637 RepID=A0A8J6U8C3_9FLAO|nr:hydroxymethylpyrimidine/phosphomethylpyrimidine kinase [Aestuariibaculum sediminum]MBD0831272.1 hydroxymethylpyrimidine/phosphomethylpyrimidine kinase [Aestuariibaculum sediminum]
MNTKKYILSIGGFDPSSGAGITQDIKTFEAHGLYGLSVCTAITVQNDIDFKECIWTHPDIISAQIKTLFERFDITVVKIGIIQSWDILLQILKQLKHLNSNIKVVLDPILKASSGFDFHSKNNQSTLDAVWTYCDIITPNYDEVKNLYPELDFQETLEHISKFTNIHLKGGHRKDKKGWDELYYIRIVMVNIPPHTQIISNKHGSGCVLSSALASNLALELPLEDASKLAKYYTEQFLNSNPSLLGNHTYQIQK